MTQSPQRPATYRELFAVGEFRAIFAANALSAAGDMLARVAITILIFDNTGSALLSAASFAISYLPSVIGGPVLATLADRLPWRTTLVGSDLVRMALVAALAIPGMPLPVLLIVLFLVALVSVPFDAARIAAMPSILSGDAYVLGVTSSALAFQLSQIVGFVSGGAIVALISARGALLINAATFGISALLLWMFMHRRPAPTAPEQRSTLGRDTQAGLRLIFGSPALRHVVLLAWCTSAFGFAHEGIAAPLADQLGGGDTDVGLLLAASPLGVVVAGIVLTRVVSPEIRLRLAPWLAGLACVALIPIAVITRVELVLLCYFISGTGMAFILPLNAAFNRIVPKEYRGRTAGVVLAGLMAGQGLAIVLAGWFADLTSPAAVVAVAGVLGTVSVMLLVPTWPSARTLTEPITVPSSYDLARGAR